MTEVHRPVIADEYVKDDTHWIVTHAGGNIKAALKRALELRDANLGQHYAVFIHPGTESPDVARGVAIYVVGSDRMENLVRKLETAEQQGLSQWGKKFSPSGSVTLSEIKKGQYLGPVKF